MSSELQNLFEQAVQAQSHGKSADALALYKEIKEKGFTSTAVELNEALVLEQQQDYGRALADIQRAQRLARRPWLASEVQDRVQKKVASNRAYSLGTFGELMENGSAIVRPSESLFLASLLLGVFLISRAMGFKHRLNGVTLGAAGVFLIFGLCATFADRTAYLRLDTELKSVPLEASATKFSLLKGTKVAVLRQSKEFVEVERPGDFRGWVEKTAIEN